MQVSIGKLEKGISAARARIVPALWTASLFLLVPGLVLAPEQAAARPENPTESAPPAAVYAGVEMCVTCHGEYEQQLAATAHGRQHFASLGSRGCETCHGPAATHADNPDDPALFPRVDKLPAARQIAVCQQCHRTGAQMFWQGSEHENRGLACSTCHSVHAPKSAAGQLKSVTVAEQCFTCHKDVRAETWKTSHHPIREGKIGCEDCHNPHGTTTESMITAVSVNDQCYSCHAEKRGPFLWEHPPVREGCLNCHVPHGSNHLKLQRTSVPFICQQCHLNTRHPGTMYDGNALAGGARASNRDFNRACLDCHASIHGSNHPSSPYLGH